MHTVASCLFVRSNSVRKIRPPHTIGDDSPAPTAAFHRTFWSGPKCTGGLPSPMPEEFGPLNWGHHTLPPFSAAPAKLDRTTVARRAIQEARVMRNSGLELCPSISVQDGRYYTPASSSLRAKSFQHAGGARLIACAWTRLAIYSIKGTGCRREVGIPAGEPAFRR